MIQSIKPKQNHLDEKMTINLGSFYTPKILVSKAYELLEKYIKNLKEYTFLDSSCGYGDFFTQDLDYIGADIDEMALNKVKNAKSICTNSLFEVHRSKFGIKDNQKIIIIGNPPYNDKTSIIRSEIKKELHSCDEKLRHRDLGISFLRSYELLNPDFVCVLHPLSYLIKEANFKALKDFKLHFRLIDDVVVSSEFFTPKSSTFFPIIIALYEKTKQGMDYEYIKKYTFKTLEQHTFSLSQFDSINHYICKYPNPKDTRKAVAYFHPLRDINALKRNKTFIQNPNKSAIKIFKENLKYYIYIHFFKKYAHLLPYYFGNMDIFIDNASFKSIENELLAWFYQKKYNEEKIKTYFLHYFTNLKDKNA